MFYRSNFPIVLCLYFSASTNVQSVNFVIKIPEGLSSDNSTYRLDYSPPYGLPLPNSTLSSSHIKDSIEFSQGLPGTKYDFNLYYTNTSVQNWLSWTAAITTPPDPPTNLSINVKTAKSAQINWNPPTIGQYSGFRIKLTSMSEKTSPREIDVDQKASSYTLRDLTPGGTYQVQLFSVFDNKESVAYTSRNFTTKPNSPGKFIVWFRNETTLLVLWHPSYPFSIYSHYKVSIDPPDPPESVLYIEKEGNPPGPAQAAFKKLIPGRAYNISVQTVSEDEISSPTAAQYRTIPLKPSKLSYEKSSISTNKLKVMWEPPTDISEFDKYQVSINVKSFSSPNTIILKSRDDPTECEISEGIEPGRTYEVLVKTVSAKVASWPISVNITLKPLPVSDIMAWLDEKTNDLLLKWTPNSYSYQDSYKISYFEVEEILNADSNQITVDKNEYVLKSLLPGRKYSITVQAVSNTMESNGTTIYRITRPSPPLLEDLEPKESALRIAWKSDINSRQHHFEVVYNRNDSLVGESVTIETFDSKALIDDLYPGARYRLQVVAVSYGRRSDTHDFYYQAVRPKPPVNLKIVNVTDSAIFFKWEAPVGTEFTEYLVRYQTENDEKWVELPKVGKYSIANISSLVPGEKYLFQINTVSYSTKSAHPLQYNHSIPPSPVSNVSASAGSSNVTLKFSRPSGLIDYYLVQWEDISDGETNTSSAKYPDSRMDPVEISIDHLTPGVMYNISIRTVSRSLESPDTFKLIHTMPVIETEVILVINQDHTDSITLRYTPQRPRVDVFRFKISEPKMPFIEKLANDTDRKVTFKGLVSGKLYEITVWALTDNIPSIPLIKKDRLYPQPITQIDAVDITAISAKLVWPSPGGEYNYFKVEYLNTQALLVQKFTLQSSIFLNDLKPFRKYIITINVVSGSESSVQRQSLPISKVIETAESAPGKPDAFYPIKIEPRSIHFEWFLPKDLHNGVLTKFTIFYLQEDSTDLFLQNFRPEESQGLIENLIPGKSYIFKLQAENRRGYGPEIVWKQMMPILAPPPPGNHVVPAEVHRTSTTIQIRFRKDYFSDKNGEVINYSIIAAEDFTKNSSGLLMPSWSDVQRYSVWPPYQVAEPCQYFQNTSVADFTIGENSCEEKPGIYCNGPLKQGSTYRVKIRAFTTTEKFTDTAYSFPITTEKDKSSLVVGSIAFIILVSVLCFSVFGFYRRRKNQLSSKKPDSNLVLNNEKSRPVSIGKFANHYQIMSADSDFYFSEEFDELKNAGKGQSCTAANLPCNRPKNRFTNILPYDHSRVKLQPVDDEEGSDYINANYVPGYNSPREFIATQGPLRSTRDDFWRMCWESNSPAIVMLTRCVEKSREKCDHYWPHDSFPEYYGDISVSILQESFCNDWVITKMLLCRGNQQRIIRHFHFITWPDFGVPNPPQIVTAFVRAFRDLIHPNQKPIIVHCSAGVGRSGTFIALDRILQTLSHTNVIDVFGVVYQMRKERVSMVQSEQQYVCIHQCVLAVLEGEEIHPTTPETLLNKAYDDDEGIAESEI